MSRGLVESLQSATWLTKVCNGASGRALIRDGTESGGKNDCKNLDMQLSLVEDEFLAERSQIM
jgi:hypothetical protein